MTSHFGTNRFLTGKKAKFLSLVLLILCSILFQNCSSSEEDGTDSTDQNSNSTFVAKGSRSIGMDILDETPSSNFSQNVTLAKEAGASFLILGLGWNQIETSTPNDCTTAGTYVDPGNALASINAVLPSTGLKLSLSIFPMSGDIELRPSNLTSLPLDDSLVVCRYQKMLTYVFSQIPQVQLTSIQFGNEVDAYGDASQVSFWGQYWGFFVQASSTAKTLRPGVKTSVVSTLYGATGVSTNPLAKEGLKQIYNSADFVSVTYYPLNSDFSVKNPSVIDAEIGKLVEIYPTKKIQFNEIGYPTGGTYISGSQDKQKTMITNIFKTWDKYPTEISHISFLRLNDISLSAAQALAATYGLGGNNSFIEYLQTLGLRDYAGSSKSSYNQLKLESSKRGW